MGLTVAEIIQDARDETGATSQEVSDATLLRWINFEYPKIMNKIYFMDKNYGYGKWIANITANVNTYSMMEPIQNGSPGGPAFGQQDIEKIMVKYDTSMSFFAECKIRDLDNFDKDLAWYETNQPKDYPFAIILDRSFIIYPKPTISLANAIELSGPKKPYKLWVGATEANILIPDQYHDILSFAIRPYIFRKRKLPNDAAAAQKDYDSKMLELLYQISVKQTTPVTTEQQDLSQFN